VSDCKITKDQTSGALLIERSIASHEKRTVRLTVIFKPVGFFMKLKCWLGIEFPGPILSEIQIESNRLRTYEKRVIERRQVREEIVVVLNPGRGLLRFVMNPEDFNRRWKVSFKIDPLYN
jgi:hypothetical protein